jgi:hypothetical protein
MEGRYYVPGVVELAGEIDIPARKAEFARRLTDLVETGLNFMASLGYVHGCIVGGPDSAHISSRCRLLSASGYADNQGKNYGETQVVAKQ